MSLAHAAKRARSAVGIDVLTRLSATVVLSKPPAATAAEGAAPLLIGTHSGSFHCDEALATGMLRLLPQYAASPVIRSRDAATWKLCDILVDVGAEYVPAARRLDHHQAGFTETYSSEHTIKLSSAGLVFKHFGAEVLREVIGDPSLDEAMLQKLVLKTYNHFVLELDAVDNGVEVSNGPVRYRISTGLSSRVARLNPAWNEESSEEEANAAFVEAMCLTTSELAQVVRGYVNSWLPARTIVQAAMDGATALHPSGQVIALGQFCPWKDHLFELEAERQGAGAPPILYVLYQDVGGSWRIQAVPASPDSFASRKPMPAPWRGIRDDKLSALTGVPDCVFVHAAGFIGGAKSYESVLRLAAMSLEAA